MRRGPLAVCRTELVLKLSCTKLEATSCAMNEDAFHALIAID